MVFILDALNYSNIKNNKKLEPKDHRILWMSNSPTVPTGYGVVTQNVVFRLKDLGYKLACLSYWGLEGSALHLDGVTIYPKLFSMYGDDAMKLCLQYLRPDVFVTLFDVWVGASWLPQSHKKWVAYCPIDHEPIPNPVYEVVKHAHVPLAMSKFGFAEMRKAGLKHAKYIPHGVDTHTFKPVDKKEARKRRFTRMDGSVIAKEDSFIIGINAMNKGLRKDFARMFGAVRTFIDNNPDAERDILLYLHTWLQFPEGINLNHLIKQFKLEKHILAVDRWTKYCGETPSKLAEWYNTLDVYLNLGHGEGFGIPLIEAQACGVPVVATEFSSMIELVSGHGWLVPVREVDMTPLLSYQALANVPKGAEALSDALNHEKKRELYGRNSRQFSLNYDYDNCVIPMWEELIKFLSEEIDERDFVKPNVALNKNVKLDGENEKKKV